MKNNIEMERGDTDCEDLYYLRKQTSGDDSDECLDSITTANFLIT
jgi:hypothetical protein